MSRGYNSDYLESLHTTTSLSVVQLSVHKRNSKGYSYHFGTGVIVHHSDGCIGVITTVHCDPASGYEVFARIGDQSDIKVDVVVAGKFLSGLVINADDVAIANKLVAVTEASFDDNIVKSEPVWAVGCFGKSLENIIAPGYIGVTNVHKIVRRSRVQTFVHSCSIGDGLIGAPIINQHGKIRGINIAPTWNVAKMNYAIGINVIKGELARLADKGNPQEPLSIILAKFGHTLLRRRMTMGQGSSSSSAILKQSKKRKN